MSAAKDEVYYVRFNEEAGAWVATCEKYPDIEVADDLSPEAAFDGLTTRLMSVRGARVDTDGWTEATRPT